MSTLLGNYLAGRYARANSEFKDAAIFFERALAQDGDNDTATDSAFTAMLSTGNYARALELAEPLAKGSSPNGFAVTALGIKAFQAKDYAKAEEFFARISNNPVGELTSTLARAWTRLAAGNTQGALDVLDAPRQAEWAQDYLRYHRALISDLGNRPAEAEQAFQRVIKADNRTLRFTLAYARHAAHAGDVKLARAILKNNIDKSGTDGHPMVRSLLDSLGDGPATPLLVTSASEGLAEVFYGLGEALTGDGMVAVSSLYLQSALMVQPDFPFALAALANVHETTKHYELALATYDRIPSGTPLDFSVDIRRAVDFNQLDRIDEAKALLDALAAKHPTEIEPLDALGNIMRARKRFPEAADYYTRAMALIKKPDKRHWAFWYARGTCYERMKKWPFAEADLKRALELAPEQPLVLNYLGYSWVDQNRNLKQGMALIEKAVQLKPDDGFIVDSLGWAHYRQGNFKEAARYLERAVELRPEDPTLNDHLGDALWKTDRAREARFQWEQALTLKPEPEDAEKIRAKLIAGLGSKRAAQPLAKTKGPTQAQAVRKRVGSNAAPKQF